MHKHIVVGLLLLTLLGCGVTKPGDDNEPGSLQGVWKVVYAEKGGQVLSPEACTRMSVDIEGDAISFVYIEDGKLRVRHGRFKVDDSSDPKKMTVDWNTTGGDQAGIYRWNKGQLEIAFWKETPNQSPQDDVRDFDSNYANVWYVVRMTRTG